MKKITQIAPYILIAAIALGAQGIAAQNAHAVDGVPPVDLNRKTDDPESPFGAFKLMQCDGPAFLNTEKAHQIKDATTGEWKLDPPNWEPDKKYVACDFKGLMIQVQFLINAAMVLGVLAAIIGFSIAGFLFLTGTPANITKAKSIFPKILWGFVIMLGAWFVVYQIIKWVTPSGSSYLM